MMHLRHHRAIANTSTDHTPNGPAAPQPVSCPHQPGARLLFALCLLCLATLPVMTFPASASSPPGCAPQCIRITDYQHPDTALAFSRVLFTQGDKRIKSPRQHTAGPWRHRFEIVVTRSGSDRVVFDELGQRHLFRLQGNGQYLASSDQSGSFTYEAEQPVWINSRGDRHQFHGSRLTRINTVEGESLTLRYQNRRLSQVIDQSGNTLQFAYPHGSLTRLITPGGSTVILPDSECPIKEEPAEEAETCESDENPAVGFTADNARADVWNLDARPASCQSYFTQYYGTERGSQIETGLRHLPQYANMVATVRSFPVVDFINGDELIVVKSRDLASPSFNSQTQPDALYERLMRDGDIIRSRLLDPLEHNGSLVTHELGQTTRLDYSPSRHVTLQLVIRYQFADQNQWNQILRAREDLLSRHGIRLEVVRIP